MAAVPAIIGAVGAIGGAAVSADAQRKAQHAAQDAANAAATSSDVTGVGGRGVNITALDALARQFALQNAVQGKALEDALSPGVSALRNNSIAALNSSITTDPQTKALADRISAQAGSGGAVNSPLLADAVAKARSDLALGGTLSTETQNLVTRKALAKAGAVAPGLGLGRDIVARDLGLTSLDLEKQRLATAAQLGTTDAGLNMQAQLNGTNNLFNSANFLSNLQGGQFARILAAAQLGQNIAQPQTGLDPSAVVNLAVGNQNASTQAKINAANIQATTAGAQSGLGSSIFGTGLGFLQNYFKTPTTTTTTPTFNWGAVNDAPQYG